MLPMMFINFFLDMNDEIVFDEIIVIIILYILGNTVIYTFFYSHTHTDNSSSIRVNPGHLQKKSVCLNCVYFRIH